MKIVILSVIVLTLSAPANAGQFDYRVGVGGAYGPEYEGGDKKDTVFLPFASVEWQRDREPSRATDGFGLHNIALDFGDGLAVTFWRINRLRASARLIYDIGRDDDISNFLERQEVSDVDGEFGGGLGVEYGDDEGLGIGVNVFTVDSDVAADLQLTYGFLGFLQAGAGLHYADKGRTQKYFGVTKGTIGDNARDAVKTGDCATAGRNPPDITADYCSEIDGGIQSWSLSLRSLIPVGQSWAFEAGVEYTTLTGDAEDSPLVEDESGVSVSVGLSYFWSN